MAVQGAARDARGFLVIDDGLAVLNDGDPSPGQRDIEALPFSWLAGQLRRSRQETIHAAHVVAGRFFDGVGLDLNFVSAAQVDAAVGGRATVKFDMQLEIFELGIVDQFRTVPGTDQVAVFNLPHRRTSSGHLPPRQVFAIKQGHRLAPFRRAFWLECGRFHAGP